MRKVCISKHCYSQVAIFNFLVVFPLKVALSWPVDWWSFHPGCPTASWAQTLAPGWRSDRPPPSPSSAEGPPGGSSAPFRSAAGKLLLWTPETHIQGHTQSANRSAKLYGQYNLTLVGFSAQDVSHCTSQTMWLLSELLYLHKTGRPGQFMTKTQLV